MSMSADPERFQESFIAALQSPLSGLPADMEELVRQPGFAVYRNTVLSGCIDALQANYPAVLRLVGEQWFRAAAAVYAAGSMPQQPTLLYYGADFPQFLSAFPPAAELPYLPAVAELDHLWCQAHGARSETPLACDALAGVSPERLARMVLRPHAAARWRWFERQPVYSIWSRNRIAAADAGELAWRGEGALLLRPHAEIAWHRLDQSGCILLDACAAGEEVADAIAAANRIRPGSDAAGLLFDLLNAGAFSAVLEPSIREAA